MTNYLDLSKAKAAAALQEVLDERGPALERLRERLVADGQDPAVFLDGTPESLVPLLRWMLSRFTDLGGPRRYGSGLRAAAGVAVLGTVHVSGGADPVHGVPGAPGRAGVLCR